MRLMLALLIALLPAVAVAQVPMSAVPAPCRSLDTMQAQPSGPWQMGADSLMHTPEADTARRYAGTSMWACKRHTGEVYIKTYTGEAVDVSGAIQQDETDFSADGEQQVTSVRLDEAGTWQVNLEVTGAGQGSVERVQGQIYVSP